MKQIESIKIYSVVYDSKIDAYNIAFEMSKNDYLFIANDIKKNNELQRKRVKMASSVYSLMKEDLKQGCLIPPIVLSLDKKEGGSINEDLQNENIEHIANYIRTNYKKIRILDGLQRTNMLLEVDHELSSEFGMFGTPSDSIFYTKKLRFEMYIGISRFGILYRMLTLNTGQTPMSLRHQVEILYSDLYKEESEGIRLVRETDTNKKVGVGKYHFNDMIEGLESYLQGDELPLDRFDILEYVKGLKAMSEKDKKNDLFKDFVKLYHSFILKIDALFKEIKFDSKTLSAELGSYLQESEINEEAIKPFGKSMVEIFTTSQAITGFGSAICQKNIDKVANDIKMIRIEQKANEVLNLLIVRLVVTTNSARRIGNTQRLFFRDFFESLFESNFIIDKAIEKAFKKTSSYKSDH